MGEQVGGDGAEEEGLGLCDLGGDGLLLCLGGWLGGEEDGEEGRDQLVEGVCVDVFCS